MTATIHQLRTPHEPPHITEASALWCATVTYVRDGRAELIDMLFDDHATLPAMLKLHPGQVAEYVVKSNPDREGGAA